MIMEIPVGGREKSINGRKDGVILILIPGKIPISSLSFLQGPLIHPLIEHACPTITSNTSIFILSFSH